MINNRILITGASGCVGQYIVAWLLENSDAELLLLIRDPKKLTAIPLDHPKIKLLIGDLREISNFANELTEVNRVIHTATAWGDPQRAQEVNVVAVKKLLDLLNPLIIEQIIYFSTASILDKELKPLQEAFTYGTEYIQTKATCLKQLEKHSLAEKIVAVFPTLVFGGKVNGNSSFPTSYLTQGLTEALKWIWIARWLKIDSNFHFIHAADIAYICGHLATNIHVPNQRVGESPLKKIVMAQQSVSINQTINSLRKWSGLRKTPQVSLPSLLIQLLIRILPIEINAWDLFSIKQRHFVHNPITNPEGLGETSYAKTLEEIFDTSGLPKHSRRRR